MRKSRLCLWLILLALLALPALAEEMAATSGDLATGSDLATPSDMERIIVCNRITNPEAEWPFCEDDDLCEIWFPRMHDCDAAVIRCGGEVVLIDCAESKQADNLLQLMRYIGVDEVRSLYNSHPHHDHLGGLDALSKQYRIGELLICFHEYYTETMKSAMSLASRRGIPVKHYDDGDVFTVGSATLTTIIRREPAWTVNNQSAMMMLRFGERTMLFTADIQQLAQTRYAEELSEEELHCDILKYPHHALAMMERSFAAKVQPLFAVITNVQRMEQPLYQLRLMGASYEFTSVGALHFATDGEVWAVELLKEADMPISEVTPRPTEVPSYWPDAWPTANP